MEMSLRFAFRCLVETQLRPRDGQDVSQLDFPGLTRIERSGFCFLTSLSCGRIDDSLVLKEPRVHVIQASLGGARVLSDQPVDCNCYCVKREEAVGKDRHAVRVLLVKILRPSSPVGHIGDYSRLKVLLTLYALCHAYDHKLEMVIVIRVKRLSLQGVHFALNKSDVINLPVRFTDRMKRDIPILQVAPHFIREGKEEIHRQINEDKLVFGLKGSGFI